MGSEKYKLEKEMPREERISRQWPPSEIAMENGNTMIPPVASHLHWSTRPWGVSDAISIVQTTTGLRLEFKTIIPVISLLQSGIFDCWERKLLLTGFLWFWSLSKLGRDFLPGIWSDLEQSICRSEEPIKKTFTAHFRLIHISGREADG